jgi:hypothetical protein
MHYRPGWNHRICQAGEEVTGKYRLPKKGIELTTDELIDMWSDIVDRYRQQKNS